MTFQLQTDKNPFQFHIIFIGMNPLREASLARTKESIREIRHVYVDLDQDAASSLRAIRTGGDTPAPNFVLDTPHEKSQVVWRVEGLDQAQAESLLRSLAVQFNGDTAAMDTSRVLRLPGFANRKYNELFLVRAIQETDAIYHRHDFADYEESPGAPRRLSESKQAPHRMPGGHRSQSEADWAYAKRALARGDSENHSTHRRLPRWGQGRPTLLRRLDR